MQHWLIGTDLCVQALALNFGLVIASATFGLANSVLVGVLFAAAVLDILLLLVVTYLLRFFGLTNATFVATTAIGIAAIWSTVFLWTG
jgi:hypothetical protein